MIELIATAALAVQSQPTAPAELGDIRMYLLWHATGQLSEDVSPPSDFAGWNTTTRADDLLIVAEVRTTGEQYFDRPALRIVARGPHNRIIGQRSFRGILTSDAGRAFLPLWLNDVTCAGDIQVTVTYGAQTRTETIALHCGE
jgi:hypothetical protein